MGFVTSVTLQAMVVLSRALELRWLKSKGLLTKLDDIFNTGLWKPLLGEIIICGFFPIPFLDNFHWEEPVEMGTALTHVNHRFNDVLLCLMFLRVYLGVRYVVSDSYFMGARGQ